MTISERIFKIMDERDISQIEFSRQTGISQSTISDWKRKGTNPSADKIMIICDVLRVTPYELLQDSPRLGGQPDCTYVSQGTPEFEIMTEVADMDKSLKNRLLGYIEALKG